MMDADVGITAEFRQRLEQEMARRGLSAERFAKLVKVSGPTISRLRRTGFATKKTIERICAALSITSDGSDAIQMSVAGYSDKTKYGGYQGKYLWLRPIFDHEEYIGCYPVSIDWNARENRLDVERPVDDGRLSYGRIFINDKGYVNIFSAYGGFASLTTLSSIDSKGYLFGAMLSLGEVRGNMVAPICCPVVLIRVQSIEGQVERLVGPGSDEYLEFKKLLKRVTDDEYAIFKAIKTA